MKFLRFFSLFAILFFVFVQPVFALTFPKPQGYVNDFAKLYSASYMQDLEQKLQAFDNKTSAEIAVVTVPDLQETTVDDFAVRLFENWKIGKKDKDNGVLLLISKKEHEVRIEVGYGLEPVITDARAGRIIREQITPEFKKGDFEGGTTAAVDTLEKYINGESVPEEAPSPAKNIDWAGIIPFLFFGLVYAGSFLARTKEFYAGGILGGVVGIILGFILGGVVAVFLATIVLGFFGLFLDFLLSKNYQQLQKAGKRTDWWGSRGGFSGGGFGGGSSGGGFGGFGGGSSGGGGASGRW